MIHEWEKLKRIYLTNIMTALRTLNPKGKISLEKIMELFLGLGI